MNENNINNNLENNNVVNENTATRIPIPDPAAQATVPDASSPTVAPTPVVEPAPVAPATPEVPQPVAQPVESQIVQPTPIQPVTPTPISSESVAPQAPVVQTADAPLPDNISNPLAPQAELASVEPVKTKKKMNPLILVLVFILVLAGGTAVWYFVSLNNAKKNPPVINTTSTTTTTTKKVEELQIGDRTKDTLEDFNHEGWEYRGMYQFESDFSDGGIAFSLYYDPTERTNCLANNADNPDAENYCNEAYVLDFQGKQFLGTAERDAKIGYFSMVEGFDIENYFNNKIVQIKDNNGNSYLAVIVDGSANTANTGLYIINKNYEVIFKYTLDSIMAKDVTLKAADDNKAFTFNEESAVTDKHITYKVTIDNDTVKVVKEA